MASKASATSRMRDSRGNVLAAQAERVARAVDVLVGVADPEGGKGQR
jgi:hypothetical protein